MMESITLSSADNQNNQTLHVEQLAGVLDNHHHHSPVDEEQMMNLSDMTDLSQEIQEDIVAIPKEVILISLVSQEQALYNPKHENYRNTQRKDMKWREIAKHLEWSDVQCKCKWKAMRDQYCRELKRSKFNAKTNVKWKYFKELDFLRPYALARNYRPRNPPATNNNNSFNYSPGSNSNGISAVSQENNTTPKFTTIKIHGATQNFTTCGFSSIKSETPNNLTEEQLTTVLQQQSDDNNWTYITGSNTSSNNATRLDNHSLSDTQHLLSTHHHQNHSQQQTDEAFYNALVDCVGQIQQQQQLCQQQSTAQQQQQITPNIDEEDDDPIHTFLNIESYFEKQLIALVQSEDVLYNSFNPNYRNVKLKLEVWDEIARKLKKNVKQCRLKWKALRDQFIREHKRLRNRENVETLPRWKHYDILSFLQKFIKHKASDYDSTKTLLQIPKTEIDADMDDEDEHINISGSSPLRSPLDDIKCELRQPELQLQHLTGVSDHQELQSQTTNHQDNLCVSTDSVGDYDDMDIDNYIIGDNGSVVDEHNDQDENEQETVDDHKSQQDFSVYSNHNTNISSDMVTTTLQQTNQAFKEQQQQQQQHDHQTQQQQHINMPSLDLNDTTTGLITSENLTTSSSTNTNSYQQNPLTNGTNITLAPAVTGLDICTQQPQPPPPPPPPPTTSEASTNTGPLQMNNNNLYAVNQEDDEVGAFFKAVAMKIRNAKLSPVAFTDLQIGILSVINGSLRKQ